MTTYPYAVTIACSGKLTVERVIAFSVTDAVMQAILGFHAAKNIAGESADDARVTKVEPDFTVASRPESCPTINEHVVKGVQAVIDGLGKQRKPKEGE